MFRSFLTLHEAGRDPLGEKSGPERRGFSIHRSMRLNDC